MTTNLTWKDLWPLLLGLGGAMLAALWIAVFVMQAPSNDLTALIQFLLTSSLPSLVIGYLIFVLGQHWLHSIRAKVLLAYTLGVVISLINIFVTSQLMFVSQHDFLLLSLLLIFAAILSASFGYLLATGITRSLRRLQAGAQRVAQGDFSTRVQLTEMDELAAVANAFNIMADRLARAAARQQQLEQSRRDLIVAVSHDLRTPLTSIRAMIEALDDGVVTDPDTITRYYHTIQSQIESLSRLIEDLFELSQLDVEQATLPREAVDLNDLLSDVLESMQAQARAKDISLQGRFYPTLPAIPVEPIKVQRAISNLIQNAIRHTPPGGNISLTTLLMPDGIQVDVIDTGEGIDPADLPHIFEQFYRGEKSRSRETGGSGLGLAITKRIIEAHGGHIWAESQLNQGTRFSFVLPLKPTP